MTTVIPNEECESRAMHLRFLTESAERFSASSVLSVRNTATARSEDIA
jgi:hypothetical protein